MRLAKTTGVVHTFPLWFHIKAAVMHAQCVVGAHRVLRLEPARWETVKSKQLATFYSTTNVQGVIVDLNAVRT